MGSALSGEAQEIPLLSPSTLNGFLGCEYQAYLNLPEQKRSLGEHRRPPQLKLLQERGERHEDDVLERITATYGDVVEVEHGGKTVGERAASTIEAMEAGRAVIYQGCLASEGWRGYPDFLIRVDKPRGHWEWSYEVHDAKLAQHPEPRHIHQLLFYSEELERIQGIAPKEMHLIVGDGTTESFAPPDFKAYADRIREAFVARYSELAAGSAPSYPYPVAACDFCDWWKYCENKRREDDHLSLTAGLQRRQGLKLEDADIHTIDALAALDVDDAAIELNRGTVATLSAQARLQVQSRGEALPHHELLAPEHERGLARLPTPSDGDVFFDFEGDPYWGEDGLEYLFGSYFAENGEWIYKPVWANDRDEERAALESWIDWISDRLHDFPDLHVFHFNSYEPTALKKLTQRHLSREDALDNLLRRKVFVDLYGITRQSARIGVERYGLKSVEAVYAFERSEELDSVGSLWRWQTYQVDGDSRWLDEIATYNADDCKSTKGLYGWLYDRRPDAETEFGVALEGLEPEPEKEPGDRAIEIQRRTDALRGKLLDGLPEDESEDVGEDRIRRTVFSLLGYYRREANPVWWEFFRRLELLPSELVDDDREALAGLQLTGTDLDAKVWEFEYPEQDHKMKPGGSAVGLLSEKSMKIDELDDRVRRLTVKIGKKDPDVPPVALIPIGPLRVDNQEDSVFEFAERVAEGGIEQRGPAFDILLQREPTFAGEPPPLSGGYEGLDQLYAQVASLDESALVVQGPPGTGKTYLGSRVAARLMKSGLKVGVMSTSHAAIDNFLAACDEAATELKLEFTGWHKSGDYESSTIRPTNKVGDPERSELLHAGTAWHWAHPDSIDSVDVLFVDEAGQVALADALAVSRAAKSLVLLGDPQQLPHVSQGTHLFGSGSSVLEHMLRGEKTIPPERGVFLDESWRMHPDLCDFVSDTMYDGRLRSEQACAVQSLESDGLTGTGIRMINVEHADNGSRSVEEAQRIAEEFAKLLSDGTFVDRDGEKRKLEVDDVLIVAAYNAQVRCLKEHLPDGARVGTVDKFQGQEAPVVIFSMASSTGDDVARGINFLLNSNRINVAISRAQALAVVVCSPSLFTARCARVEDMKLVNLLCRVSDEATVLS